MKKLILFITFLLGCFISPAFGFSQPIQLSLPDTVVAEVVRKCLPFHVNQPSDSLAGKITVEKIENLTFKDGSLAASVAMTGRDVQLNSSIGGHQIRLNVGNVNLDFSLAAVMRFDQASQTLFIRPTVSGIDQQGTQNKEVGELIAALFSDQEIPVPVDNLQPIITDIGTRELIINMSIEDIRLKPNTLDLLLTPKTSVKKK
ncbi:MAG: hypothetical protein ACR2PB_06550 [Desulfocapsaceae bacterium]